MVDLASLRDGDTVLVRAKICGTEFGNAKTGPLILSEISGKEVIINGPDVHSVVSYDIREGDPVTAIVQIDPVNSGRMPAVVEKLWDADGATWAAVNIGGRREVQRADALVRRAPDQVAVLQMEDLGDGRRADVDIGVPFKRGAISTCAPEKIGGIDDETQRLVPRREAAE